MNEYRSHYQTSHRWEPVAGLVLAIVIGVIYAISIMDWSL